MAWRFSGAVGRDVHHSVYIYTRLLFIWYFKKVLIFLRFQSADSSLVDGNLKCFHITTLSVVSL